MLDLSLFLNLAAGDKAVEGNAGLVYCTFPVDTVDCSMPLVFRVSKHSQPSALNLIYTLFSFQN